MDSPTRWEFRDFVSDGGRNEILEWHRVLPKKARAKMSSILRHLENNANWAGSSMVKPLHGPGAGLLELVFVHQNVQYRPLMFYGPQRGQVTLLLGATERGGDFDPPNAIEVAQRRKKIVISATKRTIPHDYSPA